MNPSFPMHRFRDLDDAQLIGLLVYDPVARIDVVEFFYHEYGEVLMAVGIAVVKTATGRCDADDYDELASVVIESIAELLEYGARPHPTFRAVADGEIDAEITLLPYVKQIVRNKIHQGWKRQIRHQRVGKELSEEAPEANIIYPQFELRSDLERIRKMIVEMKLSAGERAVADIYLQHFPDRPDFQSLCEALPARSEKGVRNAEARFMSKLQEGLGA
ncbi:MAG: hypothetical protein ACI8XO_000400 [Verrucomicrobiales bacterium]|jgi:hypothetical protein